MGRRDWGQMLPQPLRGGGQGTKGGTRNKYGAVRTTTADGVTHDSAGESRRWNVLQLMQRSGLIKDLQRQVRFELRVNNLKVCTYVADFTYTPAGDMAQDKRRKWLNDGNEGPLRLDVVEDFKGKMTKEAQVKLNLFAAVNGYSVHIVKTPDAPLG